MEETRTSYWDSNGKYQETYDQLWGELVPDSGEAETEEGELIRIGGRLFYEYCNNGNCNAAEREVMQEEEPCYACGGTGEEENDYYDPDDEECHEEEMTECTECGGDCYTYEEVDGDLEMSEYYGDMVDKLMVIPEIADEAIAVRELILNPKLHYNYNYDQKEMDVYNRLMDKIIEYVMVKLVRSLSVSN